MAVAAVSARAATVLSPARASGCVLLKPLARAIADGDQIHAVIRGTAINHGGKTNGYTVPNPDAQRDVVRQALAARRTGRSRRQLHRSARHRHGIGRPDRSRRPDAGVPQRRRERAVCALGSAKSNIGHLEAAAGIAGLTKVVLQMKHRTARAQPAREEVNPNIDFAGHAVRPPAGADRLESRGGAVADCRRLVFWRRRRERARRHRRVGAAHAHCRGQPLGPLPILLSAREPETLRDMRGASAWQP